MPKSRAVGTNLPIKKPTVVRFDPSRGITTVESWESVGDNLTSLAQQYQDRNVAYEMLRSNTKSTLTATSSFGTADMPDVITDTWQLAGNEIQKDIKEHPISLAMEQAFPGTISKVVYKAEAAGQGGTPSFTDINSTVRTNAQWLYNLLIRGTTHFALGQYVLRHTTSVGNSWATNISDVNIEAIYSTSALLSEISSTSYWRTPCPGRLQYKISNLYSPPAISGYLWGWRKLASTEGSAANNRIDISTEYILDQWNCGSPGIYSIA